MHQSKLASLALKILGIYCIIRFFEFFFSGFSQLAFSFLTPSDNWLSQWAISLSALLPLIFLLTAAFILIRYSDVIAKRLFYKDEPISLSKDGISEGWYVFAFSIIGATLLVWEIPSNLAQIVVNFSIPEIPDHLHIHKEAERAGWILIIHAIIKLGIGLYLVFGAKKISDFLVKINN
jgi:hypothetical protein